MSAGDGNGREEMDEGKCNQVMRTPGRRERKEVKTSDRDELKALEVKVEGRVLIEERTEGNETMQYTERATKTSS